MSEVRWGMKLKQNATLGFAYRACYPKSSISYNPQFSFPLPIYRAAKTT